MGAQRAQARAEQQAARGAGGAALRLDAEQTAELARRGVAPTDDAPKFAMSPTDAAALGAPRHPAAGGGFAEASPRRPPRRAALRSTRCPWA